jgi:hypothetical protein
MESAFLKCGAIGLALALAGCATRGGGNASSADGVDVARFHSASRPLPASQIAIEPFDRADANPLRIPRYAAAVARELTGSAGRWSPPPPAPSRLL